MARKTYTREFKIEAVQLAERSDKPMVQIAQELDIHPNTLYRWRVQYAADGKEAFPGHGKLKASDEELRRLRRELAEARQERDILKKQWPSSPGKTGEVSLHRAACARVQRAADVQGVEGLAGGLLRVA